MPRQRGPKAPVNTRTAAFFDLDRTVIADSSGLLLVHALADKGLVSERDRTIADLTRRFYRIAGETWIGMQLTRRSVGRVAGWLVDDVRAAATDSVERMVDAVWREARTLIDKHRAQGHLVCIATSTGREIVAPLAERLGVDHLIATEYEQSDGRFTGNFLGAWLWGPDKAAAILAFAAKHDVDLQGSYAYSDSFYDRPMLELVGHPRPVNPDPLLRALALRRGWPVLEFSGAEEPRRGFEVLDLLLPLSHLPLLPLSIRVEGLENIPARGGVIVAANHRSYLDPVVLTFVAARAGRKLRYLGKKEVFDVPVAGQLLKLIGQIRVDRGTGDARPLREALDALGQGDAIGIFPQGTIPRGTKFFDPVLVGRTGVARLATQSGVPVVPVAMWDNEKVWPRSHRIPRLSALATRATVHLRIGEPFTLPGADDMHAVTARVMDEICALLPDDVRNPSPPTPEQIRLATPANVKL